VLHAGYPSVQVLGVGDVVFGITSPAARLSATMLPAHFVNEVQHGARLLSLWWRSNVLTPCAAAC
jgi:hypothetical protein